MHKAGKDLLSYKELMSQVTELRNSHTALLKNFTEATQKYHKLIDRIQIYIASTGKDIETKITAK